MSSLWVRLGVALQVQRTAFRCPSTACRRLSPRFGCAGRGAEAYHFFMLAQNQLYNAQVHTPQHGLCSVTMAVITSDCDSMHSSSISLP